MLAAWPAPTEGVSSSRSARTRTGWTFPGWAGRRGLMDGHGMHLSAPNASVSTVRPARPCTSSRRSARLMSSTFFAREQRRTLD